VKNLHDHHQGHAHPAIRHPPACRDASLQVRKSKRDFAGALRPRPTADRARCEIEAFLADPGMWISGGVILPLGPWLPITDFWRCQ
jgi:hypothetical protein